MLCTYTNVAVDNLVEGLVSAGLKPLRVGYAGKVKESLLEHTLEFQLEQHPLQPKYHTVQEQIKTHNKSFQALTSRIEEYRKTNATRFGARIQAMEQDSLWKERQLSALSRKSYGIFLEMVRDVVLRADVVCIFLLISKCKSRLILFQVCTTCITAASSRLRVTDFPVVFIDEASMSTEPASLIPLMKGVCQFVVTLAFSHSNFLIVKSRLSHW